MNKILILALLAFPLNLSAQPKIQLVNFATGFDLPLDITNCGDSRLFVVERDGVIWVLDSLGNRLDTFLNIDPRVNSAQNEQGLLGLAFHPNYAENGYFFVNYTKNNGGDTRVSRFSVKPGNPNEADPNSELTILEQDQPNWNHNGGCVKFGPDGYLYIALGDGGGANDPQNYSQNKKNWLGKILRIDVNNSSQAQPYVVPADNPFVGNADYLPEIWSLGWRNPWRFSFDRLTGDMWIADVGQNQWEEANYEAAGDGGRNYGWRCYEGVNPFNTTGCLSVDNYTMPFYVYSHSGGNGCSITGGFIYRGTQFPDLYGCYLFADYCSGRWWYTRRNADGTFTTNVLGNFGGYEFSSFGEDKNGELYVTLLATGRIQRVRELCSGFSISGTATDKVCEDASEGEITLQLTGASGAASFTWSNGATSQNLANLGPGAYTVEVKDGNNCIRRDTFIIANGTPATPVIQAIDTAVCIGQPISFNLPEPPEGVGYLWHFNESPILGSPNGTFVATTTGFYQVKAISAHCSSEFSNQVLVTVFPNPEIQLTVNGNTITAAVTPANATVTWFFNNQPDPVGTGTVLLATQSGEYTAVATDLIGCSSSETENVVVTAADTPSFIKSFRITPNPTQDRVLLELEMEKSMSVQLTLTDSSQRQLWSQSMQQAMISQPIDLSTHPKGTYYLNIKSGQTVFTRAIVKH
jgi:glucose/arabinose dehydrogenase